MVRGAGAPNARITELTDFWNRPFYSVHNTIVVIALAFTAAAAFVLWRARLDVTVVVYIAVALLLDLVGNDLGARPRFILVAFPLFIGLALKLRATAYSLTLALFASGLVAYTVLVCSGRYAMP